MSLKPRRLRAVACFEKKGLEGGGGVALISSPLLSPPPFFSSHKNLLTLGRRIKFRLSPFSSTNDGQHAEEDVREVGGEFGVSTLNANGLTLGRLHGIVEFIYSRFLRQKRNHPESSALTHSVLLLMSDHSI